MKIKRSILSLASLQLMSLISEGAFYVGPSAMTWPQSRDYCVSQGGVLAVFESLAELAEGQEVCIGNCDNVQEEAGICKACWVGYADGAIGGSIENHFTRADGGVIGDCYGFNADGTPDGDHTWYPGDPDGKTEGQEVCVGLFWRSGFHAYQMCDASCYTTYSEKTWPLCMDIDASASDSSDSCGAAGELFTIKHLCQCQPECNGEFCRAIGVVADSLKEEVDGACESTGGKCCCSCSDCDGFKAYLN